MYTLLLKFSEKREYLEQMQKGLLYCNSVKYFLGIKDGNVRGDERESAFNFEYIGDSKMKFKPVNDAAGQWKAVDSHNVLFIEHYNNPLGNLFCMTKLPFTVEKEVEEVAIDKDYERFGTYFLLVTDQKQFLERIRKAAKDQDIPIGYRTIEYLNLSRYTGKKSIFQKDIKYKWQSEFRIFLNRLSDKPYTLEIGNIGDISIIGDLRTRNKLWIKSAPLC